MRFQRYTRPLPSTLLVALAFAFAAASGSSASAQTASQQASTDSLIYDLKNPDAPRRLAAARVLGTAKFQPAIPALLPLTEDTEVSVRRQVELALEEMGDIAVLPGLVQFTADSEPDIRDRAVQALVNLHLPRATGPTAALAKLGNLINFSDEYSDAVVEPDVPVDPSVVTALRARMSDSEDKIRRHTSRGLGIVRAEPAIPELLGAVARDRNPEVRFEAVRALRKIGDPSAGDRLLPMLDLNMDRVRNEIITTLGSLKCRGAVADLTRVFEEEKPGELARILALSALADIADPSSRPVFLAAKADRDVNIRLYANEGLARLGDSSLGTMMSGDRLVEKNARVRAAQAFGLLRMEREEYLDELIRALEKPTTRDLAREYLIETPTAQRPALFANQAKSATVRAELADVFGLMEDRSALPALVELARDSDSDVARNAQRAVRRITATTHVD